MSDEVKAKIVEVYDKAIAQLKSAVEFEAKGQQYSQARKDIPGNLVKFKELLAEQAGTAAPQAEPETTLTQAEQILATSRLNLEEAKKNVTNLENEPKRRAERKTKIPEETSTFKKMLDDLKSKLATVTTEGQTVQMTQAGRSLLLAQQHVCENQIATNTEELLFYEAAGDLLTVRRDIAARQSAMAEKTVEFWQQKVNDLRQKEAETAGDVTGKVTRIRIRATTIRRWDQRELIVPNKEFITGRLINWTLSDNVLRREFIVGIAYGSDTTKAEKTLYDVARANPLVLKDPKPMVIFKSFGDNSLEFELRVYIAGIDNYVPVWHSINCAIDAAFRQAGITIAFPQQDLHIRSVDKSISIDTKMGN